MSVPTDEAVITNQRFFFSETEGDVVAAMSVVGTKGKIGKNVTRGGQHAWLKSTVIGLLS